MTATYVIPGALVLLLVATAPARAQERERAMLTTDAAAESELAAPAGARCFTSGSDSASAATGWGTPWVSRPNVAGTPALAITRTSLDGRVQLTQTFTPNSGGRGTDIRMDVKNVSSVELTAAQIARYFYGDVNGTSFGDLFESTLDSACGTQQSRDLPVGSLLLTDAPAAPAWRFDEVERFGDEGANGPGLETAVSTSGLAFGTPTLPGAFVRRSMNGLGAVSPGQTTSVTVRYQRR